MIKVTKYRSDSELIAYLREFLTQAGKELVTQIGVNAVDPDLVRIVNIGCVILTRKTEVHNA
jgi:hypothetical protein